MLTVTIPVKSLTREQKIEVASMPKLDGKVLAYLSKDTSSDVRAIIARRSDAPVEILKRLFEDDYAVGDNYSNHKGIVGERVAGNPSCPPELLLVAAKREGGDWRRRVAKNPATLPEELVRSLAGDNGYAVRDAIAARRDLPGDVLELLASDRREDVRNIVARRQNLSPEVIAKLARDPSNKVRTLIARREDLSEDLLLQLVNDKARSTRSAACENLAKRKGFLDAQSPANAGLKP